MTQRVVMCVNNGGNIDCSNELKPLAAAGFEVDWKPLFHTKDEHAVIECVKGYDFVIAGSETWSRSVFDNVKDKLKLLVRFGVGMDDVDIEAATILGIPVSNTPGGNAVAVAEQAIGMMIDLTRRISQYNMEMRKGIWSTGITPSFTGIVGLVGFGAIARELAVFLKAFPVEVVAYDIFRDMKAEKEYGVKFISLDELVRNSDYISLHTPVTEETAGMVDEEFLGKMKPGAYLINTSRGRIVKESALIDALKRGMLAGAALDVFENEPLPSSSPLMGLENVILTPHSASSSTGAFREVLSRCAGNILAFSEGRDFKGLVNKDYKRYR